MTVKEYVAELSKEVEELKKMEAEFMMKKGQFDDKSKALMKELGFQETQTFHIIEVLAAFARS